MAKAPSLELVVERPGGAAIVRDYLSGSGSAVGFFGGHFHDVEAYRRKAEEVDRRFDREAREKAVEAISAPPGADASRLERFVDEGGYLVTTGQQPALFGGPLYSVYKALTAVRLAEALEARLDRPVLPLFWVASEDHDWEEANHADVIGADNELHRLEMPAPDGTRRPALHRIHLDGHIQQYVDQFAQLLPDTEFSSEYLTLLRESFRDGASIPEGFHRILGSLLGRYGLYFTDAAALEVKRRSGPVLLEELERGEEMEAVLRETAERLTAAGYDLQVPILRGALNLFLDGPLGRERIFREPNGLRLRASGTSLTTQEVRAAHERDPSALSPNVLLRPVVESALFPTLSYVGGPGEIAYFAQLGAYFQAHGIDMPVVHPRWSATAIESKIRKVLDKFEVDVGSLQRPFHEIAGEIAREEVPDEVRAALGRIRGAVGSGTGELQKATRAIDPTLKGPVQHMRSQTLAALDDLEKKIVQAVKRETDIALAQLEKAQIHLFPAGKPAERVQSPFYFLVRYGSGFLDALYERFEVHLE